MATSSVVETKPSAVMQTYARSELAFERGEGCYLISTEGRRYLDFVSGIAVNTLGHAHPAMIEALESQAKKLWHVSNLYTIPESEELAALLCDNSFADRVFFCNSGAEALEGMIKLARRYHAAAGNPQRNRIIACGGAFHGRTLTTLSAAGNAKYLEGCGPASPGFDHVPFGNMNELRAAITEETAAILVEPVQGEGGINTPDPGYLRDLRAVCDEFGLLLLLDEVQCGMGRTGRLFAHEWSEIRPDALATAKGLGGGFPVGCFMATQEASGGMGPGSHGSTFGGNPLAMAVGLAVVRQILAEGFLSSVAGAGERLKAGLERLVADYPGLFVESRGYGLMQGLKCQDELSNVTLVNTLRDKGLLTVGAGDNVVRILPPLVAGATEIDEALATLNSAAAELAS
ncbi:aspartate aminotransferase family protein [Kiloniella sp. b19]|uniref:aspartate aminotransferase family protein n=1 Tax=Kiloniella sp. GXU_MW_B19 TaxID=3141326 RepID=UPI0031D854F6